ncbi:Alpha/beta hydrolase fold-1 [Xylariaceae sp. FL0255]|nr:Alpha/beta hydrolase fold-1 [Xylariaceae sp. FL0255]
MKSSILVVHGAWRVPQSYFKLVAALESLGFEVHIPRLPSADNLFANFTESILNDGKTVIAILHSYGGHIGSNALHGLSLETRFTEKLPSCISDLIYVAGYSILKSTSLIDKIKELDHRDLIPINFDIAEGKSCLHRYPKEVVVNPQPGKEDEMGLDDYIYAFERWDYQCMEQRSAHAAWPRDMTFELATGHCLNLIAIDDLVDVVEKVAWART